MISMKRLYITLIVLLVSFVPCSMSAVAEEEKEADNVIVCEKGVVVSPIYQVKEKEYCRSEDGSYCVLDRSYAKMLSAGGIISFAPETRFNIIENNVNLLMGAIGIESGKNEIVIQTGTEAAYVGVDSRIAIRVDSYGNAFNYCLKGSVRLVSTSDNNETTLNEGEYIAITVKRGIRILKPVKQSEIDEMDIKFISGTISEYICNVTQGMNMASEYDVIEYDFAENSKIGEFKTNKVYKIVNISDRKIEHIFLADCGIDKVSLTLISSNFYISEKSKTKMGTLHPNVTLKTESDDVLYLYLYSNELDTVALYSERYISIYEHSFNTMKKMLPPICIAILLFIVYSIVKKLFIKNKNKLKFDN